MNQASGKDFTDIFHLMIVVVWFVDRVFIWGSFYPHHALSEGVICYLPEQGLTFVNL